MVDLAQQVEDGLGAGRVERLVQVGSRSQPARLGEGLAGLLGPHRGGDQRLLGLHPLAGEPPAGLRRVPVPALGQPALEVGRDRPARPWRGASRRWSSRRPTLPAHRVRRMPGPLMIIGGAEDKLRKRRILKEFVAAAGGLDARIAVIPTASSLGPEIVDVYDALFRAEGAAEVIEVRPAQPRGGHGPGPRQAHLRGDRHLHDRRQPAQAERDHLRDAGRRRDRRGAPARRRRGRHLGRGEHPVQPHGRVRRRRRDPAAADDPGRGRSGPARSRP